MAIAWIASKKNRLCEVDLGTFVVPLKVDVSLKVLSFCNSRNRLYLRLQEALHRRLRTTMTHFDECHSERKKKEGKHYVPSSTDYGLDVHFALTACCWKRLSYTISTKPCVLPEVPLNGTQCMRYPTLRVLLLRLPHRCSSLTRC